MVYGILLANYEEKHAANYEGKHAANYEEKHEENYAARQLGSTSAGSSVCPA